MDAELPGVAKCSYHLWLPRRVFYPPISYVPLASADLPVRSELDPVRRGEVDALHLALEAFFLRQAGHYEQRVAEDHPVRPVPLVVVEVHLLIEFRYAVEIGEERQLGLRLSLLRGVAEVLDQRLRVDFLLDVNRHDWNL